MLELPNGCRSGKLSVYPSNWQSPDACVSHDWYIHYRFHDPVYAEKYPQGYPARVRGMNEVKDLRGRQRLTKVLLADEEEDLRRGLNPILGRFTEASELEISVHTPFPEALERALTLLPPTKTSKEIRKALVHIGRAVAGLRYDLYPIGTVRRKHVAAVLEKVARTRSEAIGRPWGAASYNHYRAYLIILFKQLNICEACEINLEILPVRRGVKMRRIIPSDQDMELIDQKIRDRYYTFWRFIHIFLHSGARMAEMMRLRYEDVDLAAGKFYPVVLKRSGDAQQVDKTIMRCVESLWREVMAEAKPGQFLFAKGLRPGIKAINEHQVTKRWRIHIKQKLGIVADFYSLKKKNTTEIVSRELEKIRQAQLTAAAVNSQIGTAMVEKHYDDLSGERLHNQLRAI